MWLKDAAKGDMVFVQGSLEIKTYEKKTGGTAIDAQVNAQVIRAMTQKKEEATPFHGQQRAQVPAQFDDTDLPFHHEPRRVNEACLNERALRTI
jgi:single-stranded DNA-binding protein